MSTTTEYFSFQGRVAIGIRNSDGSRQPARYVYDDSKLEWAFTRSKKKKKESNSGLRGTAATMPDETSMTVNLTLGQLNDSNLAMSVAGKVVQIDAGTVTAEDIGDVSAGNMVALEGALISDLVLTDGTSATLVEDTDYTVNTTTGIVTFLATATGVTAAYSNDAWSLVTALNGDTSQEMYLLFDGLNTVDGTVLKARGEVFRVSLEPTNTLALINDDFGSVDLSGEALMDMMRMSDSKYGPYARLALLAPPASP